MESTASKYVLLTTKADAPQEKGIGGGVGSEAYLLSQVSKGLLDGEQREVKTSRNLVGGSGKPQKTIKFKWCGLWTMEFLGGKMSAGGWE